MGMLLVLCSSRSCVSWCIGAMHFISIQFITAQPSLCTLLVFPTILRNEWGYFFHYLIRYYLAQNLVQGVVFNCFNACDISLNSLKSWDFISLQCLNCIFQEMAEKVIWNEVMDIIFHYVKNFIYHTVSIKRPDLNFFQKSLLNVWYDPKNDCLNILYVVLVLYTPSAYKCHKGNSKKVISKKFREWFHSCTCILPDYVSDESSKEFGKNSHF